MCGRHLKCKVANKCSNVREWLEVVVRNKMMVPSLPLLSCESSVSMEENPDSKKKIHISTLIYFCWYSVLRFPFVFVLLKNVKLTIIRGLPKEFLFCTVNDIVL